MNQLSVSEIVRAWRDEDYFESLDSLMRGGVPANPAGELKFRAARQSADEAMSHSTMINDTCSTMINDCCSTMINQTCSTMINDCCGINN